MPLYEYLCASCGHRFEKIRKFSDPPLTDCPSCGGRVEKQFSSPAIQFKGSGWYVNDYAKAGKTESKTTSDKSASSTDSPSGSEAKSDKPASSDAAPAPAAPPAASDKK